MNKKIIFLVSAMLLISLASAGWFSHSPADFTNKDFEEGTSITGYTMKVDDIGYTVQQGTAVKKNFFGFIGRDYSLKTKDGLRCSFDWDKPTKLEITKNKIDFRQGKLSNIKCNWEMKHLGGDLYQLKQYILDIDPSFYTTDDTTAYNWTVGTFYQTKSDGENVTLNSIFDFGDGSDGALTVTSSNAIVNNYTYLSIDEASGQTVITVNDASEFSAGDEILIIQMQNGSECSLSGQYEFKDIVSINSNDITINSTLENTYCYNNPNISSSDIAQVVRVSQYTSVTINSGASITAPAWDGYKGGIVVFRANGIVNVSGSINASEKGFRGGVSTLRGPENYESNNYTVDGGEGGDGAVGHGSSCGKSTYHGCDGENGPNGAGGGGGAGNGYCCYTTVGDNASGGNGGDGGDYASYPGGNGGSGGPEGGGGGGGGHASYGGGGGGKAYNSTPNYSPNNLTRMLFGGGASAGAGGGSGGGGSGFNSKGGNANGLANPLGNGYNSTNGRNGGGIILVVSNEIFVTGQIISNGGKGGEGGDGGNAAGTGENYVGGGGGGGSGGDGAAGGSIYLGANNLILGTNKVNAIYGAGGSGGSYGAGTTSDKGATGANGVSGNAGINGSNGVIHLDYNSFSGSTDPSPSYESVFYFSLGNYTSQIFDAGSLASWDNISWGNVTSSGTNISIQTKTSDDGSSWTSWSSNHTNPSELINSSARYLQYKAELTTENTSITPYLEWVNLSYTDVVDPSVVTLNFPTNNNNSINFSSVVFNCSATTDESYSLENITLYSDYNGTWQLIETKSLTGSSNSTTFTRNIFTDRGDEFIDSAFKWNCLAYDNASQSDWGDANYTFSSWDLGTYYNTTTDNENVTLNSTGGVYDSYGNYTSQVLDAGSLASWNNLSWGHKFGWFNDTDAELPADGVDTSSSDGGFNMTRNVLLMHMNEASGTIVDTSGNGNNGTYNGALYSQTGKLNTAIGFDGGDDYVQMDDTNPLFDSTKPLTVALWVRSDGSAQVPSPTIWILKTDQSTGFLMFLNYQGGDYAGINFGSNANFLRYRTAGDISGDFINTWKYVVLTYDGVNRASVSSYKVYVDGVEQGLTEAGLFGEEPNSNRIGVDVLGSDWYFDGLIDEVAIWNRSLSADEILDIYKRGALRLNLQTKTSDDGSSWTSWSSNHTNPSNLINSSARYLQYKATLTTDNTSITPYLQWVNLSYFLLQCSPNLNENWIITDAQVCDAKEVTTGTGKITVSTGGNLSLINSANVTANGFEITRTGNCVFINKECELKIM